MSITGKQAKRNAALMASIRRRRDRKKQCRTCGKPAVISKRTKRLSRSCKKHLSADAGRKLVTVPLYWGDPDEQRRSADVFAAEYGGGRFDFRAPYRLRWL